MDETDSFLSTAQNSIGLVIAFKFTFVVTFIAGSLRIPILKVTNFRSAFGKIPKIPVLELVANKIGDTFLDYFTEIQKFPGIPSGNLGSRESREFPPGGPDVGFHVSVVLPFYVVFVVYSVHIWHFM